MTLLRTCRTRDQFIHAVQGAKSLPAMLGTMRGLRRLVCEGCSSLSEASLAGLSTLTSLHACHFNRMTCVSDATCQELAQLPKVFV